jgi:hypothetical protein
MKKITKSTIKSFINKNIDNIYVKVLSSFDGMVDCVMPVEMDFRKEIVDKTTSNYSYTLGVRGVYICGGDLYRIYEDEKYTGYECYNCCGSFLIVTNK